LKFLLRGWFNQGNLGDNLTLKVFEDRLTAKFGRSCLAFRDREIKHGFIPILAGGGCADAGSAMDYALHYFKAAERSYLIGVGINPVRDMKTTSLFQQKLGSNYLLTVRDDLSAFYADQMGKPANRVTADVCWLYEPVDLCSGEGKKVGIVFTKLPAWNWVAQKKFYMEIAAYIRQQSWQVCWISFGDLLNDGKWIRELMEKQDTEWGIGFGHQTDFHLVFQKLSGLRYIVNTRLHSVIFSYLAHLPSFSFMYSYKMEEMIKGLGLARYSAYASAGDHAIKGKASDAIERFKHFFSESFHAKTPPETRQLILADLRTSAQLNFAMFFEDLAKQGIK